MPRAVAAILAVIILAMVGVSGLEAALASGGDPVTVENETWTPDPGNVTQLDDSNQTGAYYDESVTVRDENGNLSEEGTDYEWFTANGTVKALSGGNLDGDTSATITYGYQQTSEEERALAGLLAWTPRLLGLVIPAFVVILFLLFIT